MFITVALDRFGFLFVEFSKLRSRIAGDAQKFTLETFGRHDCGHRCRENPPLHARDFRFIARKLPQQQNEDDQRDRDPDEPKKNGHGLFLSWL